MLIVRKITQPFGLEGVRAPAMVKKLERVLLSRFTVEEIQHTPKTLSVLDGIIRGTCRERRIKYMVSKALGISFCVIVRHVLIDRSAKRTLTEKNHTIQTFVLYRTNKSFGKLITHRPTTRSM